MRDSKNAVRVLVVVLAVWAVVITERATMANNRMDWLMSGSPWRYAKDNAGSEPQSKRRGKGLHL